MSHDIARILRHLDDDHDDATIVSIICTAGWHGEPCNEARTQSAGRMPCACDCHTTLARTETP
jgi:hypothetical protein